MRYSLLVLLIVTFVTQSNGFQTPGISFCSRRQSSRLHLSVPGDKVLTSQDYETIQQGGIAVIPNFIPRQEINTLRSDAQDLWNEKNSPQMLWPRMVNREILIRLAIEQSSSYRNGGTNYWELSRLVDDWELGWRPFVRI